jgi:hypothetical protein
LDSLSLFLSFYLFLSISLLLLFVFQTFFAGGGLASLFVGVVVFTVDGAVEVEVVEVFFLDSSTEPNG